MFDGLTEDQLRLIQAQALSELNVERFEEAVKAHKELIRQREAGRRWWHRFVPFTVSVAIQRRNHV